MTTQTSEYQIYETLKDSGIKWVGDIPNSWEVVRGKYLFKKVSRPVGDDDETITCFRDGEVTLRKNRRLDGFTESLKEIGYQGIRKGDLVIHAMDAFAGAIGVSDSKGKGSPILSVCISLRGDDPEYHALLIKSMSKAGWIEALAKGIRERSTDFRYETYAQQFFPRPPLDEQIKIREYLIEKKARIDSIIRKKRKLIVLLQEKRQALITQAVTKGLETNAMMKESGVEWMGEIPESWEIIRLKFLSTCNDCTLSSTEDEDLEIKYVEISNVSNENGIEKYEDLTFGTAPSRARRIVCDKDIIISTVRTYLKAVAYIQNPPENLIVSTGFAVIKPKKQLVMPKFLYYGLVNQIFVSKVEANSVGVSYPGINSSKLMTIVVAIPKKEDQQAIIDYLEECLLSIDRLVVKIESQIAKLAEYKSALIYNVVTGKMKV